MNTLVLEPGARCSLPPDTLGRVTTGAVDARVVPYEAGAPRDAGLFVTTIAEGGLVISLGDTVRVELVAVAQSEVFILPLRETLRPDDVADCDRWLRSVDQIGAWIPFVAPRALFPGEATLRSGDIVAAPREQVVWFRLDHAWWPLTDGAPLRWGGPADIEVAATSTIAMSGDLAGGLSNWASVTSVRLAQLLRGNEAARIGAMASDAAAARAAARVARDALAGVGDAEAMSPHQSQVRRLLHLAVPTTTLPPAREASARNQGDTRFANYTSLAAIAGAVLRHDNVPLPDAATSATVTTQPADPFAEVRAVAAEAGLGLRDVKLPQRLSREDGPPLVLASSADNSALAAARAVGGRYALFDADGHRTPARQTAAASGLALTPPLDTALQVAIESPARLLAALVRLSPADALAALLLGLAGVALGVAVPVATNLLFSAIWPRADWMGHWLIVTGLGITALASIALDGARTARASRLMMRFLNQFEDAIWLVLVRAAPGRLAGRSAGDLQNRLGATGRLRQAILGQPMRVVIDCAMMLTSAVMMAVYGGVLAWIGVGALALLALMWSLLLGQALHARTETERIAGRESALLSQAIAAIIKIKATASEPFLLARWARLASEKRQAVQRAERIETVIAVAAAGVAGLTAALVFTIGYPLVATGQAGAGPPATGSITLGAFLAFQAALGQTLGAAGSAAAIFALWPRLSAAGAMLAPLAQTPPETTSAARRTPAPPLDGRVEISRVTHRYEGAATDSLHDVDIAISARAYVGIVGASGSGKSTLLKLVLGLQQPSAGAIYFDGIDARRLDPASVRRQIGYVGQDSRLTPGSILDNILDGRAAGAPEAWAAARLACIAEDIEAMPMGMHTLVGEAGQNMSGGQRQRLMIARALLTRPRILIFDEATSALDNRAQAIVQAGLGDLPVTRIVVAHRLSTVMGVDQVFVLDRGRVVESGSPAELLGGDGAFAALARRQRVDVLAVGSA